MEEANLRVHGFIPGRYKVIKSSSSHIYSASMWIGIVQNIYRAS